MTNAPAQIARSAARRLADAYGPTLPSEVEAALYEPPPWIEQERYIDPTAIGGLIVGVATLAWTVFTDLRDRRRKPDLEVVARAVRVRLRETSTLDPVSRDRIIDVVVEETSRAAEGPGWVVELDAEGTG
ncbi:hypothetical protein [Micromonospora tulbaghiae]